MYLLFIDGKDNYGDQSTFEQHLTYLRCYDGTPDMWASAPDIFEAVDLAKKYHGDIIIVDKDANYKILK